MRSTGTAVDMTSASFRSPSDLLDVCRQAVRAAGDYALAQRHRGHEIHQRFAHDVKLLLDHESQQRATEMIHQHHPGDSILGEEGASSGPKHMQEWIIDPIDGTVNFFHGLSWWCSSVAVRVEGEIVAGAVYAPEVNLLYDARIDGPARLNGRTLKLDRKEPLSEALAITGSEKEMDPGALPLATAQSIAPHVQKVRILGAAAIDMCQVASGAADIFIQNGLYLWDIAAAGLIIERAGGYYSQKPTGQPGRFGVVACTHSGLQHELVARGLIAS